MNIILIGIFLCILLIFIGLIYLAIRCGIRFPKSSLAFTIIVISTSIIGYNIYDKQRKLSFIPDELKVSKIIYSKEKSWGFGLPGDNETGVIAYEMPEYISTKISKEGIDFLSSFLSSSKDNNERESYYENWHSTPIVDNNWSDSASDNNSTNIVKAKIKTYLERYGFSIAIDSNIEEQINHVIAENGSFFAYGRVGLIIVAPKIRKVFFVYSG